MNLLIQHEYYKELKKLRSLKETLSWTPWIRNKKMKNITANTIKKGQADC